MYEGTNCEGKSKVSRTSYETSAQLQAAIMSFDGFDGDGTKVVRSILHDRFTSI